MQLLLHMWNRKKDLLQFLSFSSKNKFNSPCGIAVNPTDNPATKSDNRKEVWYFGIHSRMGNRLTSPRTLHAVASLCLRISPMFGQDSRMWSSSSILWPGELGAVDESRNTEMIIENSNTFLIDTRRSTHLMRDIAAAISKRSLLHIALITRSSHSIVLTYLKFLTHNLPISTISSLIE